MAFFYASGSNVLLQVVYKPLDQFRAETQLHFFIAYAAVGAQAGYDIVVINVVNAFLFGKGEALSAFHCLYVQLYVGRV